MKEKKHLVLSILLAFSMASYAQKVNYQQDISVGKENARAVAFQYGTLDDAGRTEYVNAVGQRLVSALDTTYFPYSFEIVPTIEPNAFALPGGFCYVTTGLLELMSTEDELAGVLAHEVIHAQNRHGMKLQKKGILPALLSIPGSIIGVFNDDLGSLINAPINASGALVMAKYGRGFETEADTEGIRLAAKAGYDPRALVTALEKLERAVETATGYKQEKSYFNDHPITKDRVKRLNELLKELPAKPIAPIGALNEIVHGLPVGALRDYGTVTSDSILIMPTAQVAMQLPTGYPFAIYAGGVVASNERVGSALAVTRLSDTTSAAKEAARFRKQLANLPAEAVVADAALDQGGLSGHGFEFFEPGPRSGTRYLVWWINGENEVLQFTALAPSGYTEELRHALKSVHRITESERSSVRQRYMSVVTAQSGESLTQLSDRTGNTLSPELTALINERPPKDPLPEGAKIRVVVERPYF